MTHGGRVAFIENLCPAVLSEAAVTHKISRDQSDGRRVRGVGEPRPRERADAVGVGTGCAAGVVAGGGSGGGRPGSAGGAAGAADDPDEPAVLHRQGRAGDGCGDAGVDRTSR